MANAAEAARQNMQQKAANKLADRQGHDFEPLQVAVVGPPEAHLALGEVNQPAVGERDPVGIPPEIIEYLPRAAKRALCIDDPFDPAQRPQISGKGSG